MWICADHGRHEQCGAQRYRHHAFLSDPRSCGGGELTVFMNGVGSQFKLDAGSAVAYPANTLHHVAPVTRGARDATILGAKPGARSGTARAAVGLESARWQIFGRDGRTAVFDAVSKPHANLLRMRAGN